MKRRTGFVAVVAVTTLFLACATGCQPSANNGGAMDPQLADGASVVWSEDADCISCHEAELTYVSESHAALDCLICHANDASLDKVHEGKTVEDKIPDHLKSTKVNESVCEGCHGEYEDLAEKTTDLSSLTDKNGTCVNPHQIKDRGTGSHDPISCSDCHKEHKSVEVDTTAKNLCLSCHHENVYECGTCHE